MRSPQLPALATCALTLAICCDAADSQRGRGLFGRRSAPTVELENLTYATDSFDSAALGRRARYSVYLPKDYADEANAERRYPVVYFLHGMNEDHTRFHARGGAPILDKMVGDGTLPEVIFVCADDATRSSFYINGRIRMEDMILKDLLPHIEKTYRVRAERAHRALLGVSMGGFRRPEDRLQEPGDLRRRRHPLGSHSPGGVQGSGRGLPLGGRAQRPPGDRHLR